MGVFYNSSGILNYLNSTIVAGTEKPCCCCGICGLDDGVTLLGWNFELVGPLTDTPGSTCGCDAAWGVGSYFVPIGQWHRYTNGVLVVDTYANWLLLNSPLLIFCSNNLLDDCNAAISWDFFCPGDGLNFDWGMEAHMTCTPGNPCGETSHCGGVTQGNFGIIRFQFDNDAPNCPINFAQECSTPPAIGGICSGGQWCIEPVIV